MAGPYGTTAVNCTANTTLHIDGAASIYSTSKNKYCIYFDGTDGTNSIINTTGTIGSYHTYNIGVNKCKEFSINILKMKGITGLLGTYHSIVVQTGGASTIRFWPTDIGPKQQTLLYMQSYDKITSIVLSDAYSCVVDEQNARNSYELKVLSR